MCGRVRLSDNLHLRTVPLGGVIAAPALALARLFGRRYAG